MCIYIYIYIETPFQGLCRSLLARRSSLETAWIFVHCHFVNGTGWCPPSYVCWFITPINYRL